VVERDRPARLLPKFAVGFAAAVLSAAVAAVSLSNAASSEPAVAAIFSVALVAIPAAVGIYAWARNPELPFGRMLTTTGLLWGLASFAGSANPELYSLGRVSIWVAEIALLYLFLSYPTGRLEKRPERIVFGAAALLAAFLYLPTALVVEQYPSPIPWCDSGCPPNALALTGSEPGLIEDAVIPLRSMLTSLVWIAALGILALRLRQATPLMRRTLIPVLAAAVLCLGSITAYFLLRDVAPGAGSVEALGWLAMLSIPIMALGFLLGLLDWRLFEASALQRLAVEGGRKRDPRELRALMADVLEDPSLELCYWIPGPTGAWHDADGRRVELPDGDPERCVSAISNGNGRAAAIVHDAALCGHDAFIGAVGAAVLSTLENQRLTTALRSALRDAEESRARIAAAADEERERIERDLHDGAQQQLVTLRIKLELVADLINSDPELGAQRLRALGSDVDQVLDEIRALARGIYPPLLADSGLEEALRAAALRAPLRTKVSASGVGRHPRKVESAVYFCCLEAIQNATKHAGASAISVKVSNGGPELGFEVRDDGVGFTSNGAPTGSGLTNMRDRLAAVGGALEIRSAPGKGTAIRGRVPVAVPTRRRSPSPGRSPRHRPPAPRPGRYR
jgi:signal transduction histidine kinase